MYYIEDLSPRKRTAQWSELSIYYAHALKTCAPGHLPMLKDLLHSYSHFKDKGMKVKHPYIGASDVFYFLSGSVLQMKRLHLYMQDHGILEVEPGSVVEHRLNTWREQLPTIEELQQPFILHYDHVHKKLNADPTYGLRRSDYFSTEGIDGFIPNTLYFSVLFSGIAEIKQHFNHTPIPDGNSKVQVELGTRPHPSVTEKMKKNMYAERPDGTFNILYRHNPHSQYPTERLFEKDLLEIHKRVRAYTDSDSVHHYVRELGFACNSWDKRYWRAYFIKYTHARNFRSLVEYLDQELASVR